MWTASNFAEIKCGSEFHALVRVVNDVKIERREGERRNNSSSRLLPKMGARAL